MRSLLAVWRLLRTAAHVLGGAWTIHTRFGQLDASTREAMVQAWAQRMLQIIGISLQVQGQAPAQGPVLLVANHISWLDIVTLHATRHCRFVSKADIQHWPLVGTLASGAGTLYIERESRRDAMRVVHHMAEALRAGDVLAVFPEGTTSDGLTLLPFHANLFQAAISADAPVQPVALQFIDAASGQNSLAPCYVGDDTLMSSLWRTLTAPPLQAVVRFGDSQHADGRDRRAWAAALRESVMALRQESPEIS